MKFIKRPNTIPINDRFYLVSDLAIESDLGLITVEAIYRDGYLSTDLTTCPSCFDWLLNDLDKPYPYAAIIHDALLDYVVNVTIDGKQILVKNRREKDDLYLAALLSLGANKPLSYILYCLVRIWSLLQVFKLVL